MTIQEVTKIAMNSKKILQLKRKHWKNDEYIFLSENKNYYETWSDRGGVPLWLSVKEILAEDWEIL